MKKVAIVGVEGSGKTVMLAGLGELYSHPDVDGFFLSPKNYATASYVAEKIKRMRKGEWPVATAEDVMQGLDWTLKWWPGERQRPEEVCEVSCLDFAGEVYRLAFGIRQGAIPNDLADEVSALKKYIRNADDLIVLINLRDIIVQGGDEPRVREAMWITNEILSYALDDKGGRRVPRAAIVLSQADSYAETIAACGGALGVLQRYLPHVANNYSWLDILTASAVDKVLLDDNGYEVPAPDFQPQQLQVIMDWVLDGLEDAEPTSDDGSGEQISFKCPHCQEVLTTSADMLGAEVECPICKNRIIVPHPDVIPPATPPPPPQPQPPSSTGASPNQEKEGKKESWWETVGGWVIAIIILVRIMKGCQ